MRFVDLRGCAEGAPPSSSACVTRCAAPAPRWPAPGCIPTAEFGDVVHVHSARYEHIHASMHGLLERTPTCALHVHVGMPDAETAIAVCNRLRAHLPLLQALAAHSPYWHGADAGFATARAQLFRGFPRAVIPRAFAGWEDYVGDGRPRGSLRARSPTTRTCGGTSGRTRGSGRSRCARWTPSRGSGRSPGWPRSCTRSPSRAPTATAYVESAEALTESSFRAGRDGLGGDDLVVRRLAARRRRSPHDVLALARPYARDLGGEDALEEIERILREGNGADRMRDAHAAGGMPARAASARRRGRRAALRVHVDDVVHAHPAVDRPRVRDRHAQAAVAGGERRDVEVAVDRVAPMK